MADIIEFHQRRRVFSLDEAHDLFPLVRRITKTAQEEIRFLWERFHHLKDTDRKTECEAQIQSHFKGWQEKIGKLGCEAKGMWLVDFDSGDGYYCWNYPEPAIAYFHGYQDGFRGRVPLGPVSV
jgi:hypothetical protein